MTFAEGFEWNYVLFKTKATTSTLMKSWGKQVKFAHGEGGYQDVTGSGSRYQVNTPEKEKTYCNLRDQCDQEVPAPPPRIWLEWPPSPAGHSQMTQR